MRTRAVGFVLLLGTAAVLNKTVRLDRPWTVGHDQVGAIYSTIARNYLREGILHPPLVQKTYTGRLPPGVTFRPMLNHPPLVPLTVAAAFAATGTDAPWAARLAILPAALGTLLLLWWLVRRAAGRPIAATSVLLLALMPASAYYGVWVDPVGWWTLAGWLACLALARPWILGSNGRPPRWRQPLPAAAFLVAMFADWSAVFVLPVLLAELLARGRRRAWPAAWLLLAAFLVVGIYRVVLPGTEMGAARLLKLARPGDWNPAFAERLVVNLAALCGWPAVSLAAAGLGALAVRCARGRLSESDRLVGLLALFPLWYALVFPAGVRVHDFHLLYAMPAVATLASRVVIGAHGRLRNRLGKAGGDAVLFLFALAWALHATHQGLAGWARHDAHVLPIQTASRVIRNATRLDEPAATVEPHESLAAVRYHADRIVLGSLTTAEAVRRKLAGPDRPAVFVIWKGDRPQYPALVAWLDSVAPADRRAGFFVYDLRAVTAQARGSPDGRSAGTDRLPAPEHVVTDVEGRRVEIRWKQVDDPRVAGYRIRIGSEPGIYPFEFDVDAPRFTYRLPAVGQVHFVVAARDDEQRLGRVTEDHAFRIHAPPETLPHLLGVALAAALLVALQLIGLRGRRERH